MSRVDCLLSITLKSDLCPGSGDGFSSSIDQDVCYDEQGAPVLPGRRIKGCLREAAEFVGYNTIDEVFGAQGKSAPGSITVLNATVREDMKSVVPGDTGQTLDRYTSLRAMTALNGKTGGAKPQTLRYVRVVRHYVSCVDGPQELVFVAPISIDEKYFESLKDEVVPGLRNMGLGRNRGLGAVSCELAPLNEDETSDKAAFPHEGFRSKNVVDDMVCLSYTVTFDSPVMLPRDNGNYSGDCIPGTSVLGCFASRLCDSESFDELFLKGRVQFSPLYPLDKNGERCIPAPSFVVKIKGGDEDGLHRNGLTFKCSDEEGQSAKPLRGGFVGSDWLPVSVKSETVYHHSKQGEGTLYTQRCLSAGQSFAGFIECPLNLVGEIESILVSGELSFGRSKSAQYAYCSVTPAGRDFSRSAERVSVIPGERYALILDSDLLLRDALGCYTTDVNTLLNALSDVTGGMLGELDTLALPSLDGQFSPMGTNVRTRRVSGYNAKWNQKKPHVQAFAAGSTLVFTVPSDRRAGSLPAIWHLGDRQHEGFGRLLLVKLSDVCIEEARADDEEERAAQRKVSPDELVRQSTVALARRDSDRYRDLTRSFIGRLALMVRQSSSWEDLTNRVDTIKSKEKREAALSESGNEGLIGAVKAKMPPDAEWRLMQECLTLYLDILKYRSKQED